MNIFIDIETIPSQLPGARELAAATAKAPANYTKPESIAKWREENAEAAYRAQALDGSAGQIACICLTFDNHSSISRHFNLQLDEAAILRNAFNEIDSAIGARDMSRPLFIGHNHVAFDLPFIFKRAVINGIKPPSGMPRHPKAWDQSVFDTMIEFAGVGNRISQDRLCKALGIPGKPDDIDGSKVWETISPEPGVIDTSGIIKVAEYCADDVSKLRQIYKRLTFAS
jgi:3'-5' exonuclease